MKTTYNCEVCKKHFQEEAVVPYPKKCPNCQDKFSDAEILDWIFLNCDVEAKISYQDKEKGTRYWDCYETRNGVMEGIKNRKSRILLNNYIY